MRMVHAIQENHTEGAQQVQQTGVGGDAKIVYALLTGMVSDKVVYPIREVATNAWEISPAGKPFEVELPTPFNPQFTIRDFGPGLSHRFMMKSYAKIGESTKDDDDAAIGGWGFGSKSPLAYLMRSDGAGAFTAISRHRGFRRVYVIGVSEQGKIQIQFMGEWPLEPEDRGTGLEVSFPVREDDIERFHDLAKEVYWSFEPKPVVTPAIDFGKPRVLHSGDGWTIYDAQTVPFSGPQLTLGPVMYPIDPDNMPATEMLTSETCIVFKAEVGTISVSSSRENLQYDDRTARGLKALFDHYRDDWTKAAQASLDAEPDYFAARWKVWSIVQTLPGDSWQIARRFNYRGYDFHGDLFPNGWRVKATRWPEVRGQVFNAHQPVTFRADWSINPGELSGRKVVIQHGSSRSLERIEAAGLLDTKFLWVRCKRPDLAYALERMGNPEYIVLDDIKLPKAVRGPREKRPESVKRRKVMGLEKLTTWHDLVDLDDELLYVRITGRGRKLTHILSFDGEEDREFCVRHTDDLASLLGTMRRQGLADALADSPTCIVIAEDETPQPHWIALGDHLAEMLDAAIDPTQVAPVIPWSYNSFPTTLRTMQEKRVDLGCAPADLREVYYEMVAMSRTRAELDRESTSHDHLAAVMLNLTGTDLKTVAKDPTRPIREKFRAINERLPLLETIVTNSTYHEYVGGGNGYKLGSKGQRLLDHYFQLATK
ncbi:hypothetical protein [Methylobacterium aquaticum]|uniref:ATPase n=1 Tax=Methylobacterium aquaticum TaxID=270351 RepID=A0A0C6FCC6_9HYPH|nr:hypothetical protein [Methylobacterium aquaticum]BAQ50341.1 hypothetical protein Maq22A_3p50455 [Methylobacterium aquaticum]